MWQKAKKELGKHKKLILIIVITIIVTVILILLLRGQRRFYRRSVRQIETSIQSLGDFAPFAVIFLVIISTIIPPLPLPIPLIEIASGLTFGFLYGFLLSWAAQIISSVLCFYFARYLGKKIVKRYFSKYRFLDFYKNYLNKGGPMAIFITRAFMVAPFNVVSYLGGLTEMNGASFTLATILGTIPEALLYSFVGSIIRTTRLSLGYIFALVIVVSAFGLITTFIMLEVANLKEKVSK